MKPTATAQDVMDVAQAISGLQIYPVNAVSRVNEAGLSVTAYSVTQLAEAAPVYTK